MGSGMKPEGRTGPLRVEMCNGSKGESGDQHAVPCCWKGCANPADVLLIAFVRQGTSYIYDPDRGWVGHGGDHLVVHTLCAHHAHSYPLAGYPGHVVGTILHHEDLKPGELTRERVQAWIATAALGGLSGAAPRPHPRR